MAEFFRLTLPLGLAKAPSSRERSWRIGVSTRMEHLNEVWFNPAIFENDLLGIEFPEITRQEIIAHAWEYARCVIPQFSNWDRIVAFARTIAVGIVAEFSGPMVDVINDPAPLGINLDEQFDILFRGTEGDDSMYREFRNFLITTTEKTSLNRNSKFFHRYMTALTDSPKQWFRLRDCDALARYALTSSYVCNDIDHGWYDEEQIQILTELADTLYDATAYYKHRAEGETHSTFYYVGQDLRRETFRRYRQVLWAMDKAWSQDLLGRTTTNFIRFYGGPIHMCMRRYRFVEDDLMIGRVESERVVGQARRNFKLWYRVDATETGWSDARLGLLSQPDSPMLFPGFAEMLRQARTPSCAHCRYPDRYGAQGSGEFGGVELCTDCRLDWRQYIHNFPERAMTHFPDLPAEVLAIP